jgi:hypothetical protein
MYRSVFENVALEYDHFGVFVKVMIIIDGESGLVYLDMVEDADYTDREPPE